MYSIYIQKSKCYIVPLYDCKFWQLEGADPIYTVYIWKPSKLQRLLFQHNHREIQDTFRFLRIIACLQIAVEEDNDSLKKRMSMHKPHSSSLCSLSDCVCNCVLERICGESDMSEMHVLCVRIPPNLDNWGRWPISSSADAVIQRRDTSTVHCTMLYTKKNTKQTFIKPLQATSASWSRGFLQIACSGSCWRTHHGPFDAQLDITFTPALGVSTSQVLGLCMAFWKPDSDYLLLLTISVFNAEYIVWDWNLIWRNATEESWNVSTTLS